MAQTVVLRNFDFVNFTDKGRERDKNEDYQAYFDTLNGHVFVVCDGMGGHMGGEVASEMAVEAVGEFFNTRYYKNPFLAVENAIIFANQKVYNHAINNPDCYNMGTTIVLVLIRDNRVFYAHVGDSRLYIFKKNKLKLLTRDHSYVNKLVDEKKITQKEALNHPLRNEITKALGLFPNIEPEVANSAFIPNEGDILLLCSDGLNTMLDDQIIEKILSGKEAIEDKAAKLIQSALDNGGTDNVSVQLIRFHNVSRIYEPVEKKEFAYKIFSLFNLKFGFTAFLSIIVFFIILILFTDNDENHQEEEIPILISKGYISGNTGKLIIYPYQLKENDSLKEIAEKFNVNLEFLKSLNPNINPNDKGKHLKIPIRAIYTVQGAEDLDLVCKRYNISLVELMRANDFCSISVPVGKELIIPLSEK
ncbi:MAG: Stp1/IreP family PP2C-type Ser/Thr phosphatase [Bacteroidales bacterium]|nr:Stp1/IreP family PP2C-type Ser/Thr phosphatase [Bacteroidales bacterium]